MLILFALACATPAPHQSAPAPAEPAQPAVEIRAGTPVKLAAADRVAAADFDGDGVDTPILVKDGVATWAGARQDLGGHPQAVSRGDTDGDGREEALIASGVGRAQRDAPARIWRITGDEAEIIFERGGDRNQITDLRVVDGRVWVTLFENARVVQGGWLRDGVLEPVARTHMGMRQAPLADGRVVVGQLYGPKPRSPGTLQIQGGGRSTDLGSLRGVQSIALGDLDGDGHAELIVGDGWDSAYGTDADPRVQLYRGGPTGPATTARTIGWLTGNYTARDLEIVSDAGQPAVLATGSKDVVLLYRDDLGWASRTLGPVNETGNAVPLQTADGPAVLISGPAALVVPFRQ